MPLDYEPTDTHIIDNRTGKVHTLCDEVIVEIINTLSERISSLETEIRHIKANYSQYIPKNRSVLP